MGSYQSIVHVQDFKPYPLVVRLRGRNVYVTMPVPADYPRTPLVRYLEQELDNEDAGSTLSFLNISLNNGPRTDAAAETTVFIQAFYVYANMYKHLATPHERTLFRGVGKRTLCAVVRELKTVGDGVVRLEASGGTCRFLSQAEKARIVRDADPDIHDVMRAWKVASLTQHMEEMAADAADAEEEGDASEARKMHARIARILHDIERERRVARYSDDEVCATMENRRLIAYYRSALGFHVVEDLGDYAIMEAPLARFLEKCGTSR
jgi:hypothetical protein